MKRREYKRLSRDGRRLVGTHICIDCAKSSKGTRLGITASTHYGNAPERNRFKRLVREAFRLSRAQIPSGIDLNVIPRKLAKTATFSDIKAEFCRLLYRAQDGFVNLDSARQSRIGLQEERSSPVRKGDEKGRFCKVAASPNAHNLTERGIC